MYAAAPITDGQRSGWLRHLAISVVAMLTIVACQSGTPTVAPSLEPGGSAGPTTSGSDVPTESSTPSDASYVFNLVNGVRTLDPNIAGDQASASTVHLVQGTLYRFKADGSTEPYLVDSSETSADGRTVTLILREGLEYSDGSPIVADDFVYAYERQQDGGVFVGFLTSFESVTAPDDRTLVIELTAPTPDLEVILAQRAITANPRSLVEADPEGYFESPVSSGAYSVESWEPGGTMVLTPNPNYFGGPMVATRIELRGVADPTSRVLQLATGDVDLGYDLPVSAASSIPDNLESNAIPISGMLWLTINTAADGPLGDPLVRQAISLVVDRQAVSDTAFFGYAPPAQAFMALCETLCEPTLPGDGARDIEAAERLLADAGYANGFEMEILVTSTRPGYPETALVIAQNLADVGITVTVDPQDDTVLASRASSGDFDTVISGGASPPQVLLTTAIGTSGASATWAQFSDPAIDDLLARAAVETDAAARKSLFTEAQVAAVEQMPVVPLVERIAFYAADLPDGLLSIASGTFGIFILQSVEEREAGRPAGG